MTSDANGLTGPFSEKLDSLCLELLKALEAIERSQRRFFPPTISRLQEELLPFLPSLNQARQETRRIEPSHGFAGIRDTVDKAAGIVAQCIEMITTASRSDMEKAVIQVLQAFRKYCQAQEQVFRLRRALPAINRFFFEPEARARIDELDPDPPPRNDCGLHHVGTDRDPYARGSFSMYVPESYDGSAAWPLVVALHGGFGHGRDFLWTWLREARSRRFLLLAPTSIGTTWSLLSPEHDGGAISSVLEEVSRKWKVDGERMLLTGISDGGTFALVNSLQRASPFSAFAVIAGVLPPADLGMARGKRIYWVHGALDWMFPVKTAQRAARMLEEAEADITLRVVHDLSHAYPRDENARILAWFDPTLVPSR